VTPESAGDVAPARIRHLLFIDDSAGNVEGARAAGLAGEQWGLGQGHDVLLASLARHGVSADPNADANADLSADLGESIG
jgi:putative hydrolase of the HAD superfamily